MEPHGTIPPDRDSVSSQHHKSSITNISSSTATSGHLIPTPITSYSSGSSGSSGHQNVIERLCRPLAFDRMEMLVREMHGGDAGVPVRSQKLFLTSIPSAFMGYDLIEWLMERLSIEESEALSIANQMCLHGYFFPVNDSKTLVVRDDSSLYRFQSPYYWPWQHKAPDNIEYAIYLAKRSLRNKQRHGLEEYESDALTSLHKNLKGKWDFVTMQAEEQVKLSKDRKKGEKIVADSQERAYWRVHRPPPIQFTPLEPCPVPSRDRQGKPRRRTDEDCQREVDYLKSSMGRTRMKMSQACECLVNYWETFADYDYFLQPVLPSNPWVSEDTAFWQLNNTIVDIPTEKRVKRWAISIEELVSDPTGLQEFTNYLKKEYSHENIRFWIAVNDLRRSAQTHIARKVKEIYEEFLEPGAPCEINIDGKTMERVQVGLKAPTRFTFDAAAEHIYALLLKKDCYPRFIRSEHYKALLATGIQPSHKKRFFNFGGVAKKKSSTAAPPNVTHLSQSSGANVASGTSHLTRRRGSDRSLTGSAHELAVSGVKDSSNKVPHSHSQSNLSDIPYSVVVYRGDMPSGLTQSTITETAQNVVIDSSTATGMKDMSTSKDYPEPSKSFSENLEASVEAGACSVCPWESIKPSIESTVSVSVCPWDDDNTLPSKSESKSQIKLGNNTAIPSSVDISDVSERMKRSCGLRQNTLDCEMYRSKRLAPIVTEQRRASMTMASKLIDTTFPVREQLPNESSGHSIGHVSDESPELILPTTITEEIVDEPDKSVADCTKHFQKITTTQNVSRSNESDDHSINIKIDNDGNSSDTSIVITIQTPDRETRSVVTTPIINIVSPQTCDQADIKSEEIDVERIEQQKVEELIPLKCSMNLDLQSGRCDQKSLYDVDEQIIQEELSPTTDEYQECSVPDDFTTYVAGTDLVSGCVAPAPTPAPSIAPLAEADPADDDDESDGISLPETPVADGDQRSEQMVATRPKITKKKMKKKDGSGKSDQTKSGATENVDRNTICPWEDDDANTSSDKPFVKTYATLGYL